MFHAEHADDAKRNFAREVDEINRRAQQEAPGPEAESELADILAEHERECAAIEQVLGAGSRDGVAV